MYPILLQYLIFLLLWFSSSFNFLKYFSFSFPPCIILLRFSRACSISVHFQVYHISTLAPAKVPSLFHSSYLLLPLAKRSLSTFLCWKLRLLLLFWTSAQSPTWAPFALWLSSPPSLWSYQCLLPPPFPLWAPIPQGEPLHGSILFSSILYLKTLCTFWEYLHQGWLPCWFSDPVNESS